MQTIPTPGDTSWFTKARFGMFIHWGLYAMPARHEWIKAMEQISDEDYDFKYFRNFEPDLYDPDHWAEMADRAGMKYFVITTKHHEGFCLWDSALTDYKATNTYAKRDLLTPMVEAFRKRGLRTGFYHSLIDWHHPEYWVDCRQHPRRGELKDWDGKQDWFLEYKGSPVQWKREAPDPNIGRDQMKYADYLHGQVRELLTEFGDIDIMWFDFCFPASAYEPGADDTNFMQGKGKEAWRSEELYKMIRELQPKIILNDRLGLDEGWDVITPEQSQPMAWVTKDGKPVVWETCQTLSGSWGYYRDEETFKSVEQLLKMLIDSVSKGGNLLLNVGPTSRGQFDPRAIDRLMGMGDWMEQHSRSIYDCTQAPEEFVAPPDCRYTYNPERNRLYLHLFSYPFGGSDLVVVYGQGLKDKIAYAQMLHDGSEVKIVESMPMHGENLGAPKDSAMLLLPIKKPNVEVPVVEIILK